MPIHQIRAISTTNYQATGLKVGTEYYLAVTAVDKIGNENKRVTCVNVTPTPMPRGTVNTDISVDSYKFDKAWPGTTLLPFNYTPGKPKIIEINMLGEIVWEYQFPRGFVFDAELLPNNNILSIIYGEGLYEINRQGEIVWKYLDKQVSHDADRLPNGNTLITGLNRIVEVTPQGEVIWRLALKEVVTHSSGRGFYKAERIDIQE